MTGALRLHGTLQGGLVDPQDLDELDALDRADDPEELALVERPAELPAVALSVRRAADEGVEVGVEGVGDVLLDAFEVAGTAIFVLATVAVIVATARSPIGRANKGSLVSIRPDDLSAQIVQAVMAKVPPVVRASLVLVGKSRTSPVGTRRQT